MSFFWSQCFRAQSSCNIQASICQPGVTTSFPFITTAAGPPFDYVNPQGCGTGEYGNDFGFGFVLLQITSSGPLNLQVNGDVSIGHLDFVVYDIPLGSDPCTAILDSSNQIACNFSSQSVGCTQFGTACTGCPSIVAAPYVNAGQQIMIVVHDYDDVLTSFTLELCSGAGTGAFDATINTPPILTDTSSVITLTGATGGGTWSASCGGCINSNTGQFNPQTAGVGIYEVIYSVGNAPCEGIDTTQVIVQPNCQLLMSQGNEICDISQNTFIAAHALGNFPVQYVWTNNVTGDTLQIMTADSTTNYFNSVDTLFNIGSGIYALNITTDNGCINSSIVTLNLTPVLDSTFTYGSNVVCVNGAATYSPNFIATPTSTNFYTAQTGIVVDSTSGTIDLLNTQNGTYTIYNQPNTCSGVDSFNIIIAPAEDASFYLMDTICVFIDPTIVIPFDSIITPGNGYFWASDTNLVFIDSVNGIVDWNTANKDTVTTIYYDTGGSCSEIDSAQIYVKQLNSYFTYEFYELCIYNVSNVFPDSIHTQTGSLLTSYFYSPDPNLIIDSVTGEIDVDLSLLGTYDVIRVVNDVCSDSTVREVIVTDYFDPYFTYPVNQACQFDGLLVPDTVKHGGGTFSATPGGLILDPQVGEINLDFSASGIYTIRYITPDACGDTAYFTFEVLQVPDPTFAYSSNLYCDVAGTISPTILNSPGGVFSATNGLVLDASTGAIDLDSSHAGVYVVTYTTTGVCTASSFLTITISQTVSAYFTYPQNSYCKNLADPIPDSLAATGGTFTATPTGLAINSISGLIDLSASSANTYNIRYVSSGPCKDTAYFSLDILAVPSSNFGYPSFTYCDAAATGIISPTFVDNPGGSFSSAAGLSLNNVTGDIDLDISTTGAYSLSYITTGICPDTTAQTFTVGITPTVSFSYPSSTFCSNQFYVYPNFISVPGGVFTSSSSLLYINSVTGRIYLYYSTPGTYTITYTSPGACNASATFDVTIISSPSTYFSYPLNYYCSYNGVVSPSVMPSVTGGTFSAASGLDIDSNTGAIDFGTSTPGTYTIYYQTTGLCPTVASFTMSVHPSLCDCNTSLPVFEARVNGILTDINSLRLCYGDTLLITPELGSTWNPHPLYPGSLVPYSPMLGIDIYTCPPSVFAPDDLYVGNPCYTGVAPPSVGHAWTVINDSANFQPFVNSDDDTTLFLVPHTRYNSNTVTVYNTTLGNRCYALDTIIVQLLPEIKNIFTEICLDSSVAINVYGGLPASDSSYFTISNVYPTTAVATPTIIVNNDTSILYPIDNNGGYGFTVTDTAGCFASFNEVNFIGTPAANAGNDTVYCTLTGTLAANVPDFGYGYWLSPLDISMVDSTLNNSSFSASQTGTYTLYWVAETNANCRDIDSIVVQSSNISFSTIVTDTYCYALEGSIEFEAEGGFEPYEYSISQNQNWQSSPTFDSLSANQYFVSVQDGVGCIATDNFVIGLTSACEIIFYTGFTPNNDGMNDTWFVEGLPFGEHPCTIFNRWGDVVWETNQYDNFENAWDGTNSNGKDLPVGVYYYSITIMDEMFKGYIELTR